jgi:hypothetical protein
VDWIEQVFGDAPDGGNGLAEVPAMGVIVLVGLAVTRGHRA